MNESETRQLTSISQARTLDEIAEFWDTHSLADWCRALMLRYDVANQVMKGDLENAGRGTAGQNTGLNVGKY